MATLKTPQQAPPYYVTHQGQVRGPFYLQMIEAMVMAGQFPSNVPICKDGTEEWVAFGSDTQPPPLPSEKATKTKKHYRRGSPANITLIVMSSVVALVIGGVAINGLSKSSRSNSYSSGKTTYIPPAYTPPKTSPPSYTPPKSTYNSSSANADSTLYRNAEGRTYRVPNSAYQRLLITKSDLDTKHRSIELAKSELGSLSAEIERRRRTIDRTSQYEIDSVNSKVNSFNLKNDRLQIQVDSFNAAVDAFNAELERVGTLIP